MALDFHQLPVDPEADGEAAFHRLDMHVRHTAPGRLHKQPLDERDDRRVGPVGRRTVGCIQRIPLRKRGEGPIGVLKLGRHGKHVFRADGKTHGERQSRQCVGVRLDHGQEGMRGRGIGRRRRIVLQPHAPAPEEGRAHIGWRKPGHAQERRLESEPQAARPEGTRAQRRMVPTRLHLSSVKPL